MRKPQEPEGLDARAREVLDDDQLRRWEKMGRPICRRCLDVMIPLEEDVEKRTLSGCEPHRCWDDPRNAGPKP